MLLKEELPSSNSHFKLVWRVTSAGEDSANTRPLPSVIKHRWLAIAVNSGDGTLTLKGGESLPTGTILWDTVVSVSVTSGSSPAWRNLTDYFPYEYYKVEFNRSNPGDTTPIDIFVILKGDI